MWRVVVRSVCFQLVLLAGAVLSEPTCAGVDLVERDSVGNLLLQKEKYADRTKGQVIEEAPEIEVPLVGQSAHRSLPLAEVGSEGVASSAEALVGMSRLGSNSQTQPPYILVFGSGILVGSLITLLGVKYSSGISKPAAAGSGSQLNFNEAFDGRPPASPRETRNEDSQPLESMHLFWPRCLNLVLLMLVQSLSSVILEGFHSLLQQNRVLLVFLTMVVGTGGNVGGQSNVLTVRKLALGGDVQVVGEVWTALKLCGVLSPLAFLRCWIEGYQAAISLVIAIAVAAVCIFAAAFGTAMPKVLFWARVDPAHATPMIQVGMDILGVLTVCVVGQMLLGSFLQIS